MFSAIEAIEAAVVMCVGLSPFRRCPQLKAPCASNSPWNILCSASSKASTPPDLANLRENYVSAGIDETALPSHPHTLMAKWVEEACNCKEVRVFCGTRCCMLVYIGVFLAVMTCPASALIS